MNERKICPINREFDFDEDDWVEEEPIEETEQVNLDPIECWD